MLTVQVESFTETLEELKPLLPCHYEELALNQDKVQLSPQYGVYLHRDAMGEVLFVTLRDQGKLAGYFIGFVAPGLHYSTCLTLQMDIFYVYPTFRGNGGGHLLFRFVEQESKRRGIQRMFVGSKCHKEASWLFESLGYEKCEVFYTAWLGD
jgi:GNAT superfamily N-acetyltransferase